MNNTFYDETQITVTLMPPPPPVNSNGKGVAMKQRGSCDRSFQVQHKSDFDFHR